jgi:UPF0716 family protein affecting phage T7 exclusion
MRWILLALLLFIAADVTLLYLIAKHGGEWALIGVIFVPWLFRGPLLDWARNRAATDQSDPLAAIGDQVLLAAAGILLFVPGVLLRVAGLLLLSRRMRARARIIIGNKAAKIMGSPNGGMPGVNIAFTQMYSGGAGFPQPRVTPNTDLNGLKRAEGREVDGQFTALPDSANPDSK